MNELMRQVQTLADQVATMQRWERPIPTRNSTPTLAAADYGAKGDGTTDDATAIQAALNAASPGMRVTLKRGTHMIGTSLTIPNNNVVLEGAGADATIIRATAAATFESVLQATSRTGVTVRDLAIDGNQAARVTAGLTGRIVGLYFTTCTDCSAINIKVSNTIGSNAGASGVGIVLGGAGVRNLALGCRLINCGTAGRPSDGIFSGGTQCLIANCVATACTDTGFVLESSQYSGITGCTANGCGAGGAITAVTADAVGNFINGLTVNDYTASNTGGVQIASLGAGNLLQTIAANLIVTRVNGPGACINVRQTSTGRVNGLNILSPVLDGNVAGTAGGTQGLVLAAQNVQIVNPRIINTTNSAIQVLTGSSNVRVSGGILSPAGVAGVYSTDCANLSVTDALIVGLTGMSYGVYCAGTATGCVVTDCQISGPSVSIRVGHDPGTLPNVRWPMANVLGGTYFGAAADANLYMPSGGPFTTDNTFRSVGGFIHPGGATASRPASPTLYQDFFDTTVHALIVWDGTNWRNGAGTIV